jgi:hypothetical protein
MEPLIAFLILALLAFPFAIDQLRHEWLRQRVCAAARELGFAITTSFPTEPCPRCHEREMGLLSVAPNARSIHYQCRHCEERFHAARRGADAAPEYQSFGALLSAFNARYRRRRLQIAIVFRTPEAVAAADARVER